MSPVRKKVFNHVQLPLIGFLCVLSLSSYTNAAVDISTTAYFRHRAEAWVGGEQVFAGAAMVEVARFSADTYVIALQPDSGGPQSSLVDGTETAMVLKLPPGRPPMLLHHTSTVAPSDLNYKRSIASLFTYIHSDVPLSYSSKEGVHGQCEVTQQHTAATTLTTWHLDSCSKPFRESIRAFHHLPFLHLALDTSGSAFTCEHEWHPETRNLESGSCHESFRIAPRFSTPDKVLNVSLVSSLEKVRATPFLNPRVYNYLRSATEPTTLVWEETKPEPADATTLGGLMDEYCAGKQEMGSSFLERMGRLLQAVSSNPENLPLISPSCSASARRMLALTAAMVGGPRALSVFHRILQELESEAWSEPLLDAGPLNVMAMQSLATADPHLPADFFLRPETRNIYTQLVEELVSVQPPPVAAVAALLEALSSSAPHLLPELLAVSAPILSPAKACLEGHPQQAISTLKALAGLSVRPVDHISSLRPCFATEDVAVQVAAMESLSHVRCEVQGVTDLLRLGLESSSDPEIRIAAYQSLLHCLPRDLSLLESFSKVLTAKDETFSNQVASYIWSHLHTVRDSEDPSLAFLQEALSTSPTLANLTDPVAYDPRSHSRHAHHTWHLDAHTAFTLRADLVWGRASPAPRSISVQLLLHLDETTHDVAQVQLRVRGLQKLLLKLPGMEGLFDLLFKSGEQLWKAATTLAVSSTNSDFTQEIVKNFIQQLLSRIPSEYLDTKAEVQLSMRVLGQLLFHNLLVDTSFHQGSRLQEFLQNSLLSETVFLMPLLHNAITLPSSAGVPIDVTVNGVGGMYLLASHRQEQLSGLIDIQSSGGLSLTTQVTVASKRGLLSSLIGALDLPLTVAYEAKGGGGGVRLRARLPQEAHHTLMLWERRSRRIGREGIFRLPLKTQTSCLLEEGRLQICLQRGEGIDTHWLTPFTTSVHLTAPVGEGTITFDIDHQTVGNTDTTRFLLVEDLRDLENGRHPRTIDGSIVLEIGDVPAATLSLNTPGHTYYLRGYMGIKDGISYATEIEFVADQEHWGAKLQVSTPQLSGQRVWGPALFITTPSSGKKEALRAYLSLKELTQNVTAEFTMRTDGLLAETLLPLKVTGKVTVALTEKGTVSGVIVNSFQMTSPELFDIVLEGLLDINGNEKLGHFKISSQPDTLVKLEVSLGREEDRILETMSSTVLISPPPWTRGSFKLEMNHPKLSQPIGAEASLVLNATTTEVEVAASFGSDKGKLCFSLTNFGPGVITMISMTYSPLDITWKGRLEWLREEGHSKSSLSISWSPYSQHSFILAHEFWQQMDPFLIKLNFMVDIMGQRVELRETVSEGQAGSIRHLAEINIEPGPMISLDTVLVSRNDEDVVSYGISNEFKMDSWDDALRIVGTANCMAKTSCGLVMNVAMGANEWADLEIKYTETNESIINIDSVVFIKDLISVKMTVDVDSRKGFAQAQGAGSVFPLASQFEGEIRFNISEVDVIVVEVVAKPMTGEEQPHMIYNGTVSIVQDSRSLHTRQELWLLHDGSFQQHGMLLQGRLGPKLLDEQHFIKMTITMPNDVYYSGGFYLDSEVKEVNCSASVSLAVDAGPDDKYLIAGNFDLKHLKQNDGSTFVEDAQPVNQDIPMEHQRDRVKDETPLMSFSSLLRLNTPQTGDIKITTKGTYIEDDGKETLDLDVRLVTTTFPELGRLHMAYVIVPDVSYSVHVKVSSGRHSFSIVSYGIMSLDSMKSSSSVKVRSPTSSWQEMEVSLEMDLIGTFPEQFQSSVEVKGIFQFFRNGNFRVSVQRTASIIGFGIVFSSPWDTIPGGSTHIEWNSGDVQGHVMWGNMKAVAKLEQNKDKEGFKVAFNLDNPGANIFDIDLNLKISLVQPQDNSFLPFKFMMSGRLSLNSRYHWILNIEAHTEQYNYEVSVAFIQPSGSTSVKLQFNNPETNLYHTTGNILINGVTAYCEAVLRTMALATELDINVRSSLMAEQYHLQFWRRQTHHNEEVVEHDFGGAVRQAGDAPDWVVSYRTNVQIQKGYGGKSLVIRGRDELERQSKGKPAQRSSFWQVHAERSVDMVTIELTFPDLLPSHRLTARLKNQLDIIFDVQLYMPSSKHKFEGQIDVGGRRSWQDMEGGSLHYTHEKEGERSHPTKIQVESSWKDPTHIFFKFFIQKLHYETSSLSGEFNYKSMPPIVPLSTFEAELVAKVESNRHIYELNWRTDDYDHSASFQLENELRGTSGKILYQRFPKVLSHQGMKYEVNFNMRYFPSEVTASVTLEQSSIGRPRAITFSHSMSEGYTELVLDLFVEESDQIIVAVTEEKEEFKLQIGQFGNTFLHISYRVEKNKGTSVENHIIQDEEAEHQEILVVGDSKV